MKNTELSLLPDDFFLVDVEDGDTKETYQTLSLSNTPIMLLSFAANKFTEDASNYFKQLFGIGSVDWRMLFLLALRPGTTAAQASKTIGVDKGTVSRSVSRLTKGGFIISGDLHANGRSRGLSLSSSGRDMHEQLLVATLKQHHFLMKGFDEAEVKMFCDLLLKFTANLEELSESNT